MRTFHVRESLRQPTAGTPSASSRSARSGAVLSSEGERTIGEHQREQPRRCRRSRWKGDLAGRRRRGSTRIGCNRCRSRSAPARRRPGRSSRPPSCLPSHFQTAAVAASNMQTKISGRKSRKQLGSVDTDVTNASATEMTSKQPHTKATAGGGSCDSGGAEEEEQLQDVTALRRSRGQGSGWGSGTHLHPALAALRSVSHGEVLNPGYLVLVPVDVDRDSPPETPEGHIIRGTTSL